MVERSDDSSLNPPDCKKSRTEEYQDEGRSTVQEIQEEINRQDEAAALPEPNRAQPSQPQPSLSQSSQPQPNQSWSNQPQSSQSWPIQSRPRQSQPSQSQLSQSRPRQWRPIQARPSLRPSQSQINQSRSNAQRQRRRRSRQGKERLNQLRLSERDLSRLQFRLRQSKTAQCEKVLKWMNYNETASGSGEGCMIITNAFDRKHAMERILQLHAPETSAGPSVSRPRIAAVSRLGPSGSRIRPTADMADARGRRNNYPRSELSITPTESEQAPSDSMLVGSESGSMISEIEIETEQTPTESELGQAVSEPGENDILIGNENDMTPEMTSDSSAHDTFYSCESNVLE